MKLPVPIYSVSPADWLPYADWAQENPGEALYSEDKARRIAYVLQNWCFYDESGKGTLTLPVLWLRIDKVAGGGWPRYRPGWHTERTGNSQDTPLYPAKPDKDRLTNPEISEICRGNQWHACKFFNFVLQESTLSAVLTPAKYREYREKFDHIGSRYDLRTVLATNRDGRYRRVRWTRGEYLEVKNLEVTEGWIRGEARINDPLSPYLGDVPDELRYDRPWPLLLMTRGTPYCGTKDAVDARGGIWAKNKTVPARANDWVKA